MGFVQVGLSQVTLYHKPSLKALSMLQGKAGITMIVSVLEEKEGAAEIKAKCE